MFSSLSLSERCKRKKEKDAFKKIVNLFRRANKIFNLYLEKYFPLYSKEVFEKAKHIHEKRWKGYDEHEREEQLLEAGVKAACALLEHIDEHSPSNNDLQYRTTFLQFLQTELVKIETIIAASTHNLTHKDINKALFDLPEQVQAFDKFKWRGIKSLLQQHIEMIKPQQKIFSEIKQNILECVYKELDQPFYLYYSADDRNDDDIVVNVDNLADEIQIILKKIKALLKEKNQEQLYINTAIATVFLNKITYVFSSQRIAPELQQLPPHIESWSKLGLWLIEQYQNKEHINKYDCARQLKVKLIYSNLALCLANLSSSDFQLAQAENYLELSEVLSVANLPGFETFFQLSLMNPTSRAVIAYKRKHFDDFLFWLDKAVAAYLSKHQELIHKSVPVYTKLLIDLSCQAGEYLRQTHPERSLKYYSNALNILNSYNDNSTFCAHPSNKELQSRRGSIEEVCKSIKAHLFENLKQALGERFNAGNVRSFPSQDAFYIPFEKLPPREQLILTKQHKLNIEIVKVYQDEEINGQKYTGIKIKALTFDSLKVIQSIESLFKRDQKLAPTPASRAKQARMPAEPASALIAPLAKMQINPNDHNKQIVKTAEPLPNVTQTSDTIEIKKVKKKTRPAPKIPTSIMEPSPLPPPPPPLPKTYAKDFGFSSAPEAEVTPIYFSSQGQQRRRPTVFVRWEGIKPKVEPKVEQLFESMLYPHIEGLVTVGMVNQPGVKLFTPPQDLGDNWNLCALRMKRKGHGGGWLRAIAIPEEKVEVLTEGHLEARYLFKIGKPKNK